MLIFGPKCQFWAKFGRFWAQNPIFWGQGVKILVPSYRDSNETPFSCWKHWSVGLKLAARGENVLFWPQNLDIWGQKSIFCLVIAIFVDGPNDHYTWGYNFPIGTTPKKFCFWDRSQYFRLGPFLKNRMTILTQDFNVFNLSMVIVEYRVLFWQKLTEKRPIFQKQNDQKITKMAPNLCGSNPHFS